MSSESNLSKKRKNVGNSTIDNYFKRKCVDKENDPPQSESLEDSNDQHPELTASHSQDMG